MATLTGEYTLQDVKAMHDPKGNLAQAVDTLSEVNGVLSTATWMEANDLTSHVVTQSLTEGAGSAGIINQGVAYETTKVKQVRFPIEMFETYSRVDERELKIATNPEAFRSQKDAYMLKSLGRAWHSRFFYGDSTDDPAAVDGLATTYNDLGMDNVVGAGGTGSDLASMWVIQWGMDGCYLVYPRGGNTMLEMEDLGRDLVNDSVGVYTAMVTHFGINWGVAVADERAVQRIANIETAGATNIFDEDDVIRAITRLPDPGNLANTAIYVNRSIYAQMQIAMKNKQNVNFYPDESGLSGKPVMTFQGIPVVMVDKLLSTETALT